MAVDETAFKEIHKEVVMLTTANALTTQRQAEQDRRIERAFEQIAEARAECRTENENFRRAIARLFDSVNTINGGVAMLKWLIPLWATLLTIAVSVLVWVTS